MSKTSNHLRYTDDVGVFHEEYGFGWTMNPPKGSTYLQVRFDSGDMARVHEDDLKWPLSYDDAALIFGRRVARGANLSWLYQSNENLDGRTPKEAIDDGDLPAVEVEFARYLESQ